MTFWLRTRCRNPRVLREGQGGHVGVKGCYVKEATSELKFQKLLA